MSLRERLEADMKAAMKSRDTLRLETTRGVRGAMRNKEIELGETLTDDGILRVIRTLVKQRADSIEQFQAAGRKELAEEEESAERRLLESYLPAAPDAAAVEQAVAAAIAELGAQGPKDMGRVMKAALERLGAAADGKLVSQVAKRLLAGGSAARSSSLAPASVRSASRWHSGSRPGRNPSPRLNVTPRDIISRFPRRARRQAGCWISPCARRAAAAVAKPQISRLHTSERP